LKKPYYYNVLRPTGLSLSGQFSLLI